VKLTDAQYKALELAEQGLMINQIDSVASTDIWGETVPGIRTFRKLEKLGFLVFTEEDPMEDGTEFTSSVILTDEGEKFLKMKGKAT